MFSDDSFTGIEDLFNQLAGGRTRYHQTSRGQNENILGTIESRKETILIFDLSGKKITSLEIKDNIETNEYGERVHSGQKVLTIKLSNNETLKYVLPKSIAKRKMTHTFANGILEVSLKK